MEGEVPMTEDSKPSIIGQEVLEFIDHLSQRYGEDWELGVLGIVAEMTVIDSDGNEASIVEYSCTDPRRWIQAAFFDMAAEGARRCMGDSVLDFDIEDEEEDE